MGILGKLKGAVVGGNAESKIEQLYPVDKITPDECQDCELHYPAKFSIDEDSPLYGSAKPAHAQILIASGRTNWTHDSGDEPEAWGQVKKKLGDASSSFEEIVGGAVRVNVSDLEEDSDPNKVKVIVLPQFLEVITTPENCVSDVTEILSIKDTSLRPAKFQVRNERGFVTVCSHKTRDKRCGISAPILRQALETELRDVDLYRDFDDDTPGGVRVVYSDHVGGHKFAANCFIYQNDGQCILMGRVRPEYARAIVQKTILHNTVFPDLVRNCSKLQAYEW